VASECVDRAFGNIRPLDVEAIGGAVASAAKGAADEIVNRVGKQGGLFAGAREARAAVCGRRAGTMRSRYAVGAKRRRGSTAPKRAGPAATSTARDRSTAATTMTLVVHSRPLLSPDAVSPGCVPTQLCSRRGTKNARRRPLASASFAEFLWVSAPEARHSRSIALRPEVAIVIFDSTVPIGAAEALYLEAKAERLSGAVVDRAIATYSHRSQACGARAWEAADVLPPAAFRLYCATASSQFVLGPHDQRLPVGTDAPTREPGGAEA
jgi:hypothetical protein